MAQRDIIQASKAGGTREDDLLLRSPSERVVDFDGGLQALIADLLDTMAAHAVCVGLAAPQIGVRARVAVADVGEDEPLVMVNPEVLGTSGKRDTKRESCMSLWGLTGSVERREKVMVRFQDANGTEQVRQFRSFPARVVLHEVDHLEGKLYDRDVTGGLQSTELFDGDSPTT